MSAALAQLQARFAAGILGEDRAILDALCAHGGLDAAERFAIYRDAYRARLVDALADTFGHSARYLGEDCFQARARAYVETHAPTAASIRWYGAQWPAWLRRAYPQDAAAAELAALDWALRAAFDGADAAPLEAAALAGLSPQDWDRVRFRLHPSLRLLAQRWNTVALWQALDAGQTPPAARRLPQAGVVAVWRRELQPHFRTLDRDEHAALRSLRAGAPFAALCTRLAETRAPQDAAAIAGHWLRRWLDEGLLLGLR
jgi:Putative DNA-binding domain